MGLLQELAQLTSSPLQRNSFTRFIAMTTKVLSSAPGGATFSAEQIAALSAPLDRAKVKQREQGRSKVSYLEGWQAIAEANRIFGFDGWQRETVTLRCVNQSERTIGRDNRPGWGVTYTARVRISISTAGQPALIREGSGAGHGIDVDLGLAHESAVKEAETDAMKRALMTFGNPFGLALYDKQQREVTSSAGEGSTPPPTSASNGTRSIHRRPSLAAPSPTNDPSLIPLDPVITRQILATLRGLPRPVLEGFTKAFRKRFQVPEEAPSIADRILQKRHHDWIEAFLVQHQAPASSQPDAQPG
jgi:DNA recombination protein Rad52